MEESILKCQYCEEPLMIKDDKCEKCGAPVYVNDVVDFSDDTEDFPEENAPGPSAKPAYLIASYYLLLLVFPGILLSNYLVRAALKKTAGNALLLTNALSFLILFAGLVLAGRWMEREINEGNENPDHSEKLMKWNLVISCLISGLILIGLNSYNSIK